MTSEALQREYPVLAKAIYRPKEGHPISVLDLVDSLHEEIIKNGWKRGLKEPVYWHLKKHKEVRKEAQRFMFEKYGYRRYTSTEPRKTTPRIKTEDNRGIDAKVRSPDDFDDLMRKADQLLAGVDSGVPSDYTIDDNTGRKKFNKKHIKQYNRLVEVILSRRAVNEKWTDDQIRNVMNNLIREDEEEDELIPRDDD